MKPAIFIVLLWSGVALAGSAAAVEQREAGQRSPAAPIGWLELQAGSHNFSVSVGDLQKVTRSLPEGALLPVFKTKEKHGVTFAQVGALNLNMGSSELGWVEVTPSEMKPARSYPLDSELLESLGGPYLEDFTSEHTDIARFLVRQSQGPPALLCYVVTMPRSMAKLVVFTPTQGKYLPSDASDIFLTDIHAGILSFEVRDLLGDGSDCVITKEPFREQAQSFGTTLRIRRIVDGKLQTLWQAPVELQNLSRYSSKLQILQPPVQNIGVPGTVTTGEVTFRPSGKGQEPVWKGKVEFFVFGRDRAVNAVNIEKACPWDGKEFVPLR